MEFLLIFLVLAIATLLTGFTLSRIVALVLS